MYRDSKGRIRIDWSAFGKLAIFLIGLIIGFYLCKGIDGKASIIKWDLKPNKEDVKLLADLINLENGGSFERMYYTGCVVLNRRDYCDWCPDSIEGVINQKGQYAVVSKIGRTKPSKEAVLISMCLLVFGHDTPHNLIFQSRFRQGKKVWKVIDGEYFCLE